MVLARKHLFLVLNICLAVCLTAYQAIGQNEEPTITISVKEFLDILDQQFDIYFIGETSVLESSTIRYNQSLLEEPIAEVIEYFKENTPFKAIRMFSEGDSTLVYSIKREENKAKLSGKIVDENNAGLWGATIRIPALNVGTISDKNGYYNLELDAGNHTIEASYVGKKQTELIVNIGPGEQESLNPILEDVDYVDEILITGSRNATTGSLGAGSTIIDHGIIASLINLKGREIESYVETSELLQAQQPSFYSVHQHVSDGTDHIDAATLRGMSPDQTLILINGKRRHQSALLNISNTVGKGSVLTDLNTIPISIIDRIEILQDGAASHYGSDAIAGVINIILKESTYSEINVKSGISKHGDGLIYDIGSNFGLKLNEDGALLNVSVNHLERHATNRTDYYNGPVFQDMRDQNPQATGDVFKSTVFDSTKVTRFGQSEITASNVFYNLKIPINKSIELYSFGGYSYKRGESIGVYRFPYQLREDEVPNANGFSPLLVTNISDQAFTFGLKKVYNNAVLDISNTTGGNAITFYILDPSNAGPQSPADVIAGKSQYGQNITNVDYSHLINNGIPISLNAGAEIRIENYKQVAGDAQSSIALDEVIGDVGNENLQLFPRFDESHELSEYRRNIGIYLDSEIDPSKQLKIGLSGRFERYDDFGSNFTWKLFSRYNPSKFFSFKVSANTGFRAPSLHQYYYTSTLNQFVPSEDGGLKAAKVDHYNHAPANSNTGLSALNIDPLKPERSFNMNVGFITRPIEHLSIALNAYQINVDDRIILSGRLSADLNPEIGAVLSTTNSADIQFFTNAIGTKTTGLEFITKYRIPFAQTNSSLDLSVSGHLNSNVVQESDQGARLQNLNSLLQPYEQQIFNRSEVALYESAQPASKFIFATSYQKGKLGVHARMTRFGSVTYLHPLDGDRSQWVQNGTGEVESRDQTYRGKWLTDFSMQYAFTNSLSLSLGGTNIFNIYPDENSHSANRGFGMFPYNRFVSQFGTRGAFYHANLNIKF